MLTGRFMRLGPSGDEGPMELVNAIVRQALLAWMALAALIAHPALAQEQLWIRPFEVERMYGIPSICSDGSGGLFGAGVVTDAVTFDEDIVVLRFGHKGDLIWTRQFGTAYREKNPQITSDGEGGAYICGWTNGSLGGPSSGLQDTFLTHFDADGNQSWVRQFIYTGDDPPLGLAHDNAGGVYICGSVRDGLGFPSAGYWDIYLIRFDRSGNRVWERQFGSDSQDRAGNLAIDGLGGVYIAGTLPGNFSGVSTGSGYHFVAHFDDQGTRSWLHRFPDIADGSAVEHLVFDGVSGVYAGGHVTDRNGSTGLYPYDFFVSHYSNTGVPNWTFRVGTSEREGLAGLVADGQGGLTVYGRTEGALFGTLLGEGDQFLAHYDSSQNLTWSSQFGSSEDEWAKGIVTDDAGGMLITGTAFGGYGGGPAGQWNGFMARIGDAGCYHADCDRSTGISVLDVFDFLCFQQSFVNADPLACDCDTSTGLGVCDIFDFLCFQNAFVAGCP